MWRCLLLSQCSSSPTPPAFVWSQRLLSQYIRYHFRPWQTQRCHWVSCSNLVVLYLLHQNLITLGHIVWLLGGLQLPSKPRYVLLQQDSKHSRHISQTCHFFAEIISATWPFYCRNKEISVLLCPIIFRNVGTCKCLFQNRQPYSYPQLRTAPMKAHSVRWKHNQNSRKRAASFCGN